MIRTCSGPILTWGQENFWRYLQIRNCVASKIQYNEDNNILDYLKLPEECHRASVFYRTSNQLLSDDCMSLKTLWEKDLGCSWTKEEWLEMLSSNGKYVREMKGKFTQYKIMHRFYWTPLRLHRMRLLENDRCLKCQREMGTLLHCMWECRNIHLFWMKVLECLCNWLGEELPVSPTLCLLADRTQMQRTSNANFSIIMAGTTTAARIILILEITQNARIT